MDKSHISCTPPKYQEGLEEETFILLQEILAKAKGVKHDLLRLQKIVESTNSATI